MTLPNKRLTAILLSIPALLLVPFIAMQFSSEVQWTGFDFLVAGILLLAAGLTLELILRKAATTRQRIILGIALLIVFLLVWAELAVGVFGTPFAGS